MLPFPRMSTYGNTVIPQPYQVLFSLNNFSTTADIVDKSGNNITVNNASAIGVGTDTYGTYMNFTGSNTQWLNFTSPVLNIGMSGIEFYFKMSGLVYKGGTYSTVFLDTRPLNTNGNYLVTWYSSQSPSPFSTSLNLNLVEGESTLKLPTDQSIPFEYRIRSTSTGTNVYVNNVLFNSSAQVFNANSAQNYTISKNAYYGSANTPFLTARIYNFEIRKLLGVF